MSTPQSSDSNSSWPGLLLVGHEGQLRICESLLGRHFFDFVSHGGELLVSCRDGCSLVTMNGEVRHYCTEVFACLSGGPTFFVGVSPSTPTDNTTPSQQQQQQLPSQTPLKSQTGQQQQLYSWGIEGHLGQLGQGLNKRECTDPARIASVASTAFVQVSSGEAFTIALDTNGLGYAFGENFSGQLALYRKHKNEMIYPQNALIEEMTFIPRLMPFTMQLPLRKVSCGQRFVVAITKDGRLFSWGAGESGQLGTGRCTKKDIPSLISFPTTTTTEANSLTVQDVACGSGHTLALLSDGTLYSWGLNQRGQCGTGDILVRHSPTKIDLPAANMTGWKVIADGHSSALLNTAGEIYTWGSIQHGRLLLPLPTPIIEDSTLPPRLPQGILRPEKVISSVLEGLKVERFIFTQTSCAALVKATLTGAWPLKGPKRHFSQFQIFGFGLWKSSQILVKFASQTPSIYNPPRSVLGRYNEEDGSILCKAPKFGEVGWYTVSLSMDGGKEFFAQTFSVLIYKEPIILRQLPAVIDLRHDSLPSLQFEVQGKVEEAEEGAELKLSFYPVRPEETVSSPKKQSMSMMMTPSAVTPSPATRSSATGLSRTPLYEIEVSARIITPSTTTTTAAVIPTTHESIIEQPQSARTAETNQTGSSSAKYPEATYWLECQPFAISNELQSVGQLLELNCQLSLNKQDFTANPSKQEIPGSLCHAFQPLELSPDCYALADLNHLMTARQKNEKHANDGDDDDNSELSLQKFERKVIVHGESFFPSSRLQKGAHIKAFCVRYRQPEEESTLISKLEEEILEGIDPLLVTCQSSSIMQFSLSVNCLTQIHHVLSTKNPSLFSSSPSSSSSSGVQLDFVFALESSRADGSTEMILLNQKPLSIFFYADSPLTISPNWCRKTAEQIFEITPTGSVGFPFHPIHAMVQVRFADDLLPLQTFSNSTLAIVPIIQDQHKNDEEQQHEVVIEEEKSLEEKKELTVVTEGLSQQQQPQQQHASAYKISFQLHLPDSTSAIPDHCIVSLALDGKSFSSQTATVALLSSLAKYTFQPALPKGGAPPNSTVGLLLEQHCPPLPADMICVRLYGSDESVGVTVPAVMSDVQAPATVLQFTLPDQKTMKELAPIVQGKEKLLHVAVSIDGGKTFDNPEKPMLQVK
eukprot:gene140-148_t